jgi:hypothetical protein
MMMKDLDLDEVVSDINVGGKKVPVRALIETPERTKIDVDKLSKLVPKTEFMQIVSATKKDVETIAGRTILAQVSTLEPGTENVSIKEFDA